MSKVKQAYKEIEDVVGDDFVSDSDFMKAAYSRNVDPRTGRPRRLMSTGKCTTDWGTDPNPDPDCLTGDSYRDPAAPQNDPIQLGDGNALEQHSINQQLFMMICSTSIGFSSLDPAACGKTVFTSQNPAIEDGDITSNSPTVSVAVGGILAPSSGTAVSTVDTKVLELGPGQIR